MSSQTSISSYLVRLKNRFLLADRTLALQFEKPPGFTFVPGQWIDITLLNPSETDEKGNTRGFSIASAPHEDFLVVVTRLRDTAYKRQLTHLPLNTEVKLDGPGGNLRLHNKTEHAAVFLVGGIGITPVRSILLHAAHDKLKHQIFVFFSNRRPEDTAFLEELADLQKKNPNITLIATMTNMTKSACSWNGETARIDKAMLAKYLTDAKSPIYYIVGPTDMINGVHETLNKVGIDDDDIRSEEFEGYGLTREGLGDVVCLFTNSARNQQTNNVPCKDINNVPCKDINNVPCKDINSVPCKAIRMLRSTWRELETWNGRDDVALTLANESASEQENRIRPKPARLISTLPERGRRQLVYWSGQCDIFCEIRGQRKR